MGEASHQNLGRSFADLPVSDLVSQKHVGWPVTVAVAAAAAAPMNLVWESLVNYEHSTGFLRYHHQAKLNSLDYSPVPQDLATEPRVQGVGGKERWVGDSVQCTVYSVQCTVYSVQCTVYSVQYTVYSVQCTEYSVQCTVYSVQRTVYSVHCTLYSVQCAVYSVQCIMYNGTFPCSRGGSNLIVRDLELNP